MKTVLNRGIRAFPLEKTRVKPGTVLIETVLSGDYLHYEKSSPKLLVFPKRKKRPIIFWYLTCKIVFTLLTINFMIFFVRLFTKKAEWYVTQHRNECKRLQRWIAGLSNFPNGLSNRLSPSEAPVRYNVLRNHPLLKEWKNWFETVQNNCLHLHILYGPCSIHKKKKYSVWPLTSATEVLG